MRGEMNIVIPFTLALHDSQVQYMQNGNQTAPLLRNLIKVCGTIIKPLYSDGPKS